MQPEDLGEGWIKPRIAVVICDGAATATTTRLALISGLAPVKCGARA